MLWEMLLSQIMMFSAGASAVFQNVSRGKTGTKSAPKRIFSANGNGLKSVFFL